ncbi:Fur family transcriptional regulator [Candidatus Hydrogenedentota bacterium]
MDAVFATHSHFDADELLFSFRRKGLPVSKATIYRTLELLIKSGLVRILDYDDAHHHYEHVFGHEHHDHLVCKACGSIAEFDNQEIEKLQNEVCAERGFKPESHSLRIFGLCKVCTQK